MLGHLADEDCQREREQLALWEKSSEEDKPGIDRLCKKSYDSEVARQGGKSLPSAPPAKSGETFPWSACKTYMQWACSPEHLAVEHGADHCASAKQTLAMRPDPTLDPDLNRAAFANNERFCRDVVESSGSHPH